MTWAEERLAHTPPVLSVYLQVEGVGPMADTGVTGRSCDRSWGRGRWVRCWHTDPTSNGKDGQWTLHSRVYHDR